MFRMTERYLAFCSRVSLPSYVPVYTHVDNTMDILPNQTKEEMDRGHCESLAQHVLRAKDLPMDCQMKYSDLVQTIKRRETDTTHPSHLLS
jgi:hypothetical protein